MKETVQGLTGRLIFRFSGVSPKGASLPYLAENSGATIDDLTGLLDQFGPEAATRHDPKAQLSNAVRRTVADEALASITETSFQLSLRHGSRFSAPGEFKALYLSGAERTAVTEVSHHCRRRFHNPRRPLPTREFKYQGTMVKVDENGHYYDLRNGVPNAHRNCLNPDMGEGYKDGQALAQELIARNYDGIIYPSVRHSGGVCMVLFDLSLIHDLRWGRKLLLRLHKSGEITPHFE